MSTKDVNVQQKSKAYFIKKYHPLHHKETEDRRRDRRKILACPEEVFRDRLESLSQMQQLFEKNISVIVTPIYVDEHRNSSYFPPLPLLNLSQIETEPIEQQQHWFKKLKSIEVDLKSYFDDDAKVGLEHLLKSLLSTVVCRKCNDPVDEDMVQVKCSSCFHTYHARLCAGLSYVPKKKAWLCPECL